MKNTANNIQVMSAWSMHELTRHPHNISNVRTSHSQIDESSYQLLIWAGIRKQSDVWSWSRWFTSIGKSADRAPSIPISWSRLRHTSVEWCISPPWNGPPSYPRKTLITPSLWYQRQYAEASSGMTTLLAHRQLKQWGRLTANDDRSSPIS